MTRFILCCMLLALPAAGEDWPEFRGPGGQGHAAAERLPLQWSETENIRWKTAIDGQGWSTPVIFAGQIWLTTASATGSQRGALGIDRSTGRILHDITLFEIDAVQSQHQLNSHASPSPVIEAGRVYLHFGAYGTACVDTTDGTVIWQRDDLKLEHQVGPGSSPILYNEMLIIHCDGTDVQYIIALDKHTGRTIWKTQRTADLSQYVEAMHKASCTPIIMDINGRDLLISLGAHGLYGYDPADGRELWRYDFHGYSNVSRPVADGSTVIFSTGYDRALLKAVQLDEADVTAVPAEKWTYARNVPQMPSPVVVDGRVYTVDDSGILSCIDTATGEMVWRERIGGQYAASLLYADGRIYAFSQEGDTTIFAPGDVYKPLAVNKLDEGFMASPAVAGNALYLRTRTHLYCIE